MHIPLCLQAIAAGKHVFCEKPFAALSQDPSAVIEAARRKRVFLMVGHCIRFWPEYQHLEKLVKSAEYGRLLSLTMQRRSSPPLYSKGNWLQNTKRSGGAILDLHIHDTDYILHLLGRPSSVYSVGTRDASGWAHVFTTYQYKNVAVTAEGGWNYPGRWGFNMSFQALFENALLEFDFSQNPTLKLTVGDKEPSPVLLPKPKARKSASGQGRVVGNINDLGGYLNELAYYVNCCEKNERPQISTGRDALNTLNVIRAEMESLVSREAVTLRK
jgi:predicted dehydrogenase